MGFRALPKSSLALVAVASACPGSKLMPRGMPTSSIRGISHSGPIVTVGGSASNANLIVDTKSVVPDETYLFPELVGQWLEPGSFIVTQASAATTLTIRASGVEYTS